MYKHIDQQLLEIETELLVREIENPDVAPKFTDEAFRASLKIFNTAMLDQIWNASERFGLTMKQREKAAYKMGDALRRFVLMHTGIDTRELY